MAINASLLSLTIIVILSVVSVNGTSNILVFLPFATKSHQHVFLPLVEELARKNRVVFVSSINSSAENVEYISVESGKNFTKMWSELWTKRTTNQLTLDAVKQPLKILLEACELLYNEAGFNQFRAEITSKRRLHFDAVITMGILNECSMSWIHSLNAPLILVYPSVLFPHAAWNVGVPFPLSYLASPALPFRSPMTFTQRFTNVFTSIFYTFMLKFAIGPGVDLVGTKYIPNPVSSWDTIANASIVLVNSHISLDESKPKVPFVVDVGGMHCRDGAKIPKVFEEFVNSSGDDGFIVMSMGSVVQGSKLPSEFTQLFKNIFARVKQKVIWKYEDTIEGLSPNVMLSKWIPQQDLMAHPKCRLAITHGGLLSLQEVVYHGVPLLGVPLGADRDFNINQAINKGFALLLNWKEATVDEAFSKVDALINDNKYKAMAKKISQLTRDRPQTPVETAAFWVEYVIRHKGAAHLKNDGIRQLNFLQYLGLDVIAFLASIVAVAIAIFIFFLRFIFKILKGCVTKRPKLKIN